MLFPLSFSWNQQKIQEYEFTDDPLSDVAPPRLPRNDTIDRFWASVEPYCADITNEDLKMLDELIKSGEEETEFFKVPSLGKHYSVRWAHEDLLEEQREGTYMYIMDRINKIS